MQHVRIPVGRSGFADIRKHNYCFVDKSMLIAELLKTDATQVTLITRPRRFGKTLGMSMLSAFFDIRGDSRALFEGLAVAEDQVLCAEWMNRYPTLFLTFKDVGGRTFGSALEMLKVALSNVCVEHAYLLESEKVDPDDRRRFAQLKALEAGEAVVKTGIALLIRMMHAHYGREVILLLDEYDAPIARAGGDFGAKQGYYSEMMEVLSALIGTAIKDNDLLKFAVVTGCLKIAKESIFTGTNNFVSDTISDTRLNEYFGFTRPEVERLLADTGLADRAGEIREWYDGYRFGAVEVYCPWDVMNHIRNVLLDSNTRPSGYWKNSSDNAVIRSFIDYAGESITKKFEALLAGESIAQRIQEDLTYDTLHTAEENLWSVLYFTGYLTRAGDMGQGQSSQEGLPLRIPNAEIRELFETTVRHWFEESARRWDRKALFAAVWGGDPERATQEISRLLRRTISYHDYREDFYHAFLAGIFAGAGYQVESNREHGEGRSDIVVQDDTGDRVAVFEIKYANSQEGLEHSCGEAIAQMEGRGYAQGFAEEYSRVLCYGISFFKKRCLVRKKGQETTVK